MLFSQISPPEEIMRILDCFLIFLIPITIGSLAIGGISYLLAKEFGVNEVSKIRIFKIFTSLSFLIFYVLAFVKNF